MSFELQTRQYLIISVVIISVVTYLFYKTDLEECKINCFGVINRKCLSETFKHAAKIWTTFNSA